MPAVSNSDGMPTIYVPLIIIVLVTAIKDFYEDYKRKKSDQEENNRKCKIWDKASKNFKVV